MADDEDRRRHEQLGNQQNQNLRNHQEMVLQLLHQQQLLQLQGIIMDQVLGQQHANAVAGFNNNQGGLNDRNGDNREYSPPPPEDVDSDQDFADDDDDPDLMIQLNIMNNAAAANQNDDIFDVNLYNFTPSDSEASLSEDELDDEIPAPRLQRVNVLEAGEIGEEQVRREQEQPPRENQHPRMEQQINDMEREERMLDIVNFDDELGAARNRAEEGNNVGIWDYMRAMYPLPPPNPPQFGGPMVPLPPVENPPPRFGLQLPIHPNNQVPQDIAVNHAPFPPVDNLPADPAARDNMADMDVPYHVPYNQNLLFDANWRDLNVPQVQHPHQPDVREALPPQHLPPPVNYDDYLQFPPQNQGQDLRRILQARIQGLRNVEMYYPGRDRQQLYQQIRDLERQIGRLPEPVAENPAGEQHQAPLPDLAREPWNIFQLDGNFEQDRREGEGMDGVEEQGPAMVAHPPPNQAVQDLFVGAEIRVLDPLFMRPPPPPPPPPPVADDPQENLRRLMEFQQLAERFRWPPRRAYHPPRANPGDEAQLGLPQLAHPRPIPVHQPQLARPRPFFRPNLVNPNVNVRMQVGPNLVRFEELRQLMQAGQRIRMEPFGFAMRGARNEERRAEHERILREQLQNRRNEGLPPLAANAPEIAEEAYKAVSMVLPDINKQWVLDRGGYAIDRLVNYVLDNQVNVPKQPRSQPCSSKTVVADDDDMEEDEELAQIQIDNEKNQVIADFLKTYIRNFNEKHIVRKTRIPQELKSFLITKYPLLKGTMIEKMTQNNEDIRVIIAASRLIHMKKMTRKVAGELNLKYLWHRGIHAPWLKKEYKPRERVEAGTQLKELYDEVDSMVMAVLEAQYCYTCCICLENYKKERISSCVLEEESHDMPREDCHYFCHSCMRRQCAALCEDGLLAPNGAGLRCMDPFCENIIPISRVNPLLCRDIRTRLWKRIDSEVLANIEGLESCKSCSYAMVIEVPPEENKVFDCANCQVQFCRLCKIDWKIHIGRRCEEMKGLEDEVDANRKKLEEELAEAVKRTCHRCGLVFSKTDGCNKVTCRCGATQCYICRAGDISYAHFCQHLRDPNNPGCPENCTGCLLYADTDVVNRVAIDDVRERARNNVELQGLLDQL